MLDELASAHSPLFTTALKKVVVVNGPDVKVFVVLAMVVTVVKAAEVELSHLTTLPVLPVNVNTPDVPPAQIVEPPVTFPPTESGLTLIPILLESAVVTTTHGLLDTISQVIVSVFAKVVDENVDELAPEMLEPFNFH